VDNGRIRWLAVDLPESIAVRSRWLPDSDRHTNLACSALDFRWMDHVDPSRGVFITAAGLLMYFERKDVERLTPHYTTPPMPFWIHADQKETRPEIPVRMADPVHGTAAAALVHRGQAPDALSAAIC